MITVAGLGVFVVGAAGRRHTNSGCSTHAVGVKRLGRSMTLAGLVGVGALALVLSLLDLVLAALGDL
jgi:hypothetical protein